MALPIAVLSASQFAPFGPGGQSVFNNVARNYFRSPMYFDTDFSVMKNFLSDGTSEAAVGCEHVQRAQPPNFFSPVNNVASGAFGTLGATSVDAPLPYGAFQGAGVSGRLIQMQAKLIF